MLVRSLIEQGEISAVCIEATKMVEKAIEIHHFSTKTAEEFGKALISMTYFSCWLKDKQGEISVNLNRKGGCGNICISGNSSLFMRGYAENPKADNLNFEKGYMTIVRSDNYSVPFVGTCELSNDLDSSFENYYKVSEQLPTFLKTQVIIEDGKCKAAGGIFFQPMPFSSIESKQKAERFSKETDNLALKIKELGALKFINQYSPLESESREEEYHCNCSKKNISNILYSMGKKELLQIIQEEGSVKVHCHYCNTDYVFLQKDIENMFAEKNGERK